MYAIEFETVIKNKFIELQNAEDLINKQVRIIVLVEDQKESSDGSGEIDSNELIKQVFNDAVNLTIDSNIDINALCNEVNW